MFFSNRGIAFQGDGFAAVVGVVDYIPSKKLEQNELANSTPIWPGDPNSVVLNQGDLTAFLWDDRCIASKIWLEKGEE